MSDYVYCLRCGLWWWKCECDFPIPSRPFMDGEMARDAKREGVPVG